MAAGPSTASAGRAPAERLAAAEIGSELPHDQLKATFASILRQIGTRCGTRDYESIANVILATQQQLIGHGVGGQSLLVIGRGLASSLPAKGKVRLRAVAVDYVMRQSQRDDARGLVGEANPVTKPSARSIAAPR